MSAQATPAALSPSALINRIKQVDGLDSGLDADLVRGRAMPSGFFRFDIAPQFMAPPMYAETQSLSLFGV